MWSIEHLVRDFAEAIRRADAHLPIAYSLRSGKAYQAGIGPHTETQTVNLVLEELRAIDPATYARGETDVPYPAFPRQRCDLVFNADGGPWHVEVKMMRMLGDNGKTNENILAHILSPYPQHRSALTDCTKLSVSGFVGRCAILIYGYEYEGWPLEPVIEAFEKLAQRNVSLSNRCLAQFTDLGHPGHQRGAVYGWELHRLRTNVETSEHA
jgi:hypothetical protein